MRSQGVRRSGEWKKEVGVAIMLTGETRLPLPGELIRCLIPRRQGEPSPAPVPTRLTGLQDAVPGVFVVKKAQRWSDGRGGGGLHLVGFRLRDFASLALDDTPSPPSGIVYLPSATLSDTLISILRDELATVARENRLAVGRKSPIAAQADWYDKHSFGQIGFCTVFGETVLLQERFYLDSSYRSFLLPPQATLRLSDNPLYVAPVVLDEVYQYDLALTEGSAFSRASVADGKPGDGPAVLPRIEQGFSQIPLATKRSAGRRTLSIEDDATTAHDTSGSDLIKQWSSSSSDETL